MVLAQKQKYRSIVQDRIPRGKPTHLWAPNLRQRRQEHTMEKEQCFQQMVLRKLDFHMQKNKSWTPTLQPYTKKLLKIAQRPKL